MEKSLDIIVRARNETRQGFQGAERDLSQFGKQVATVAGGLIALDTTVKTIAASTMLIMAGRQQAAALAREDIEGALKAQLEMNRAYSEFGRSVPLIGESIGKMVDAINDTEGINRMAASLKQLETSADRVVASAQKFRRERVLLEAQLAGKSPTEIAGIKVGERAEDREARLKALKTDLTEADKVVREARALWRDAERAEAGAVFGMFSQRKAVARAALSAAHKDYERIKAETEAAEKDVAASAAAEQELQRKKEAEDARKAAEDKVKLETDARAKIRAYTETDMERQVRLAREEGDALREAARKDLSDYRERSDAIIAINREEADRIWEIRAEAAERAEARAEQAAARDRARIEKRIADEEGAARLRENIENLLFNATHGRQEIAARALEQRYAAFRRQVAPEFGPFTTEQQSLLGMLDTAQERELHKLLLGSSGATTDVSAFSARFLTHAPGRTADPEWAKNLQSQGKEQTDLLRGIANKLDVSIDAMRWN